MSNHIEEAKKAISGDIGRLSDGTWNFQSVRARNSVAQAESLIAAAEELHGIMEQLRIGNLIAMRAAWTPVEARHSEDMQDFYHVGNQIDAEIAKALGIKEES